MINVAQIAVCLQRGTHSLCCYANMRIGILSSDNELLSSNDNNDVDYDQDQTQ